MQRHPAMIRWCLYLHHKSSGCYDTLRNSGILNLPLDLTVMDYKHSLSSRAGFSKELDLELFEAILNKSLNIQPNMLVLHWMKCMLKGLYFDKHTGSLVGFSDLGAVNNLQSNYEQQLMSSHTTPIPMAKLMLERTLHYPQTSIRTIPSLKYKRWGCIPFGMAGYKIFNLSRPLYNNHYL